MSDITKILTIIDNEIDKSGMTKGKVAELLNVSGATISNLFNRKYNKIGYMKFIELTRIVFGKYHHEYIERFCLEYKGKLEVEALEWAFANGNIKVLNSLISHQKQKKTYPLVIEVYELQVKRMSIGMKPSEFYEEYQKIKFGSKNVKSKKHEVKTMDFETAILLEIFSMYALVDSKAYQAIRPISQSLLVQIQDIESEYLRIAYTKRVELALIFASIKSNDLRTAEEAAKQLITKEVYKMFPIHYNHALIYLTEIHIFDSYEKSSFYIKEAVKMVEDGFLDENDRQKKNVKSTYDFVHIFHNETREKLYLEDPAECAHILAKGNLDEKKQALDILDKLLIKKGELSNFQSYYKALAEENLKLMEMVKDKFYISGDFHYVKLPKMYLDSAPNLIK
ncbi:AimR family lysis-lysogeny pheromone receptor [Priestia megaterium]|uniref:AimR family lysis-lysogeny pheromone receptor n=1 Tax=Priestia megaterium TaxID=1404 RepID=UPI0025B1CD68|nr:AimR family lysis-lysogeny pheromone receptor [Priestia megaterium]MDN3365404.1 AimR family lysis-lysogeny pheromone receptor [Priestia megaterium]